MNDAVLMPRSVSVEPKLLTHRWVIAFVSVLIACVVWRMLEQADWGVLAGLWEPFTQRGGFHLPLVNEDSSLLWILCPTVLMLAWAGSLLLLFDQPPDWLRLLPQEYTPPIRRKVPGLRPA